MATSVNAVGLEGGSAGSSVTSYSYTSITVASGSNTALVFCCGFGAPGVTGVTATWDNGGTNQAMTLIASQGASSFNNGPPVYVFGLLNPTPGNKTLRLTWTTSSEICGAAVAYDGVDTSSIANAFTNVSKAGNTSANPSVTVTSATGNAAVAVVLSTNSLSAPTQTPVFTESGFTYNNAYAVQRAAGASSVSLGWTGPSANNAIIGFNVAAGSSGTTVNISGAACQALAGTVTKQISGSVSLTGAAASALAGSVSPSVSDSVSITGASCSALAGGVSITVSDSASISGASAAAVAGAVTTTRSGSVSLTGASVAALAGTTTPKVSATTSGASAAALAGVVTTATSDSAAISGASVAALAGAVSTSTSVARTIVGASCAAVAGAVTTTASGSVSITGAAAQALAGDVSTQSGGGATVNIVGAQAAALAGDVSTSVARQVSITGASVSAVAGGIGKTESVSPQGAACQALAGAAVASIRAILGGAAAAALAGALAVGVAALPDGAQAAALAGPVSIAGSTQVVLTGAACQAVAGNVTTKIVVTALNPNYIARGEARQMVAAGLPRSLVAIGTPRDYVVVGISNAMAQTNNLEPPIDETVEIATATFDFGPIIKPGVTMVWPPTMTCVVYEGTEDPNPSSRLIDDPQIIPSPNTGAVNGAVAQLVGTMIAGTTYRIQCVCATTDGQNLSLWTHLACQAPN